MTPQYNQVTIVSGSVFADAGGGAVLSVKICTLGITVAFDGGPPQACAAATVFANPFRTVVFSNTNALPVTVGYWIGDKAISFAPADNSVSAAATFVYGNLGVAVGQGVNAAYAGSPACDALGYLAISNAANLLIPSVGVRGKAQGHRRQAIIFTLAATGYIVPATGLATVSLNVLDSSGFVVMTIPPGGIIQISSDSDLSVSGAGGACGVSIGQIFLANN